MNIDELGWNAALERAFQPHGEAGLLPGRVACAHAVLFDVWTESGEYSASVPGKFAHAARSRADFPAVGDWVALEPLPGEPRGVIHAVLPRRSVFSRKAPGETTEEQVIAANIDTLFLVTALDHDFSPRRIERYLTLARECGANPVILLNKADACENVAECVAEVDAVAMGVAVHTISALTGEGLDVVRPYAQAGKTIALLGSSGVGKSTLVNALSGEARMEVREVREDDQRGRHTTTHRELIRLPNGGLLIDTPGLREVQLWASEENLERTFDDVATVAAQCRFRDCTHQQEPGCAVREAVESGKLSKDRLESYFKLQRELQYLTRRQDKSAAAVERAKWKQIHKEIKRLYSDK